MKSTLGSIFREQKASKNQDSLPLTAFNELLVSQPYPTIQQSFQYDVLSPQLYLSYTSGGSSSVAVSNSVCSLTIGTGLGDYSTLRTRRLLKYRPGQGVDLRFTTVFNEAKAGTWQLAGIGSATNALYFGYNGLNFGILREYNGLLEIRKLTITGASSASEEAKVTLNDVEFKVNLTNAGGVISYTAHELQNGSYTGWTVEHINDSLYFLASSTGSKSGTYSFVSGTASGTFSQITAGLANTQEWTYRTDWNVDKMDGSGDSQMVLDQTKGNVYRIEFQYLGFGCLNFYIEDDDTGRFQLVHRMKYPNKHTTPSVLQPSFSPQFAVYNIGGSEGITLKLVSIAGFIQGKINRFEPRGSLTNEKAILSNTETNIMVIKNRLTFNEFAVNSEIFLQNFSIASDGTKSVTVRLYLTKSDTQIGADTTSDYDNFQFYDQNNSIVLYDTTSKTVTSATKVLTLSLAKVESKFIDLTSYNIVLERDQAIVITAQSTGASTVTTSLAWIEDI